MSERLRRLVPQAYAERLLTTQGQPKSERRLVTILFSDVKGSTAMTEALDPEDVMEIMDGAFDVLIEPIYRHEGTLARLMGDAILAFFGAPIAHDNDAQRAVCAALEIVAGARDYAARLAQERGVAGFNVRVGINTGLVVVGEVGSDLRVEYTAMGDAINLAARMEQNAPVGGVLISRDTYRLVRGAFDVQAQAPLAVKGKSEPVQTYLVLRARPRGFHLGTRGVEGVEAPMIGRDAELKRLQDAFFTVVEDGEFQMVTVTGEAGVGKSRLLYEFDGWAESQPEAFWLLKGRAEQEMQARPYALLRDLFSFSFQIQDSDPLPIVREKVEAGIVQALDQRAQSRAHSSAPMRAHFIGQLLGFDFSHSPHLQAAEIGPQQLHDRALAYIGDHFKALAIRQPVVIFLEDLQWADDSSLDVLAHLASGMAGHQVLIVCAARPGLFARRPHWGEGQAFHTLLRLQPLSRRDSRTLADEILRRVAAIPGVLRDMLVDHAEGNPFYVEEIVKMLLEDGVIVRGGERWRVEADRLALARVPDTLTAVLQARLDHLAAGEKTALQQASVLGRTFWDGAVTFLGDPAAGALPETVATLKDLRQREMVFQRETSTFASTQEYVFRHALLRDTTYESVLKRDRRVYHSRAAQWLVANSKERVDEYAGLIAEHLERAGEGEKALSHLRRAGEQAAAQFANAEAVGYFSRALELTPQQNIVQRYELLLAREVVYNLQGNRQAQAQDLAALEALAETLDDDHKRARVTVRWANYANAISDFPQACAAAQAAVAIAQATSDTATEAAARHMWGSALCQLGQFEAAQAQITRALQMARALGNRQGEVESLLTSGSIIFMSQPEDRAAAKQYYEQALALSQEIGNQLWERIALHYLAIISITQGEFVQAMTYSQKGLATYQEVGAQLGEGAALHVLGAALQALGVYDQAIAHYQRALALYQEVGDRYDEGRVLDDLGHVLQILGEYDQAMAHYQQALDIARELGTPGQEGAVLNDLGEVTYLLGDYAQAQAYFEQALALRREQEQPSGVAEDLAGLARVALAREEPSTPEREQYFAGLKQLVTEILPIIESTELQGMVHPWRVPLTCYRVLRACGDDAKATGILALCYAELQALAAKIPDETLQRSFLENVPVHRELASAWQEANRLDGVELQ